MSVYVEVEGYIVYKSSKGLKVALDILKDGGNGWVNSSNRWLDTEGTENNENPGKHVNFKEKKLRIPHQIYRNLSRVMESPLAQDALQQFTGIERHSIIKDIKECYVIMTCNDGDFSATIFTKREEEPELTTTHVDLERYASEVGIDEPVYTEDEFDGHNADVRGEWERDVIDAFFDYHNCQSSIINATLTPVPVPVPMPVLLNRSIGTVEELRDIISEEIVGAMQITVQPGRYTELPISISSSSSGTYAYQNSIMTTGAYSAPNVTVDRLLTSGDY